MLRILLLAIIGTTLIACEMSCSGSTAHGHIDPDHTVSTTKDYIPAISLGLDASILAFTTWGNDSVSKRNFSECIAATTLTSAAKVGKSILMTEYADEGQHVIPSPQLNFSKCTPLKPMLFDPKSVEAQATLTTTEAALNIATNGVVMYLGKIKDCKTRVIVTAVVHYMNGALGPILEEVKAPDGVLNIPPVTFSFNECQPIPRG